MPIYEYRCGDCGEVFSELRSMSDASPVCCERCSSKNTSKLMSSFATGGGSSGAGAGACLPSGGG